MTTTGDITQRTRFDVRQFARTARGNHRDSLELDEFETTPLSADSLHLVRYLARLESATMEHLRNLLVTATHKDARVTAFLVTWAFEKFWIADALDAVLEANGEARSHELEEGEPRHDRSEHVERRGPIRRAVSAIRLGVPIIAVHVTEGLVDDWTMRAAYLRLAAASKSAALASVVSMVLDVKSRHTEFFEDESRRRLEDSSRARQLTRKSLLTGVFPIGSIDRAAADRDFFESFVFGDAEGREAATLVGSLVAALPGQDDSVGQSIARKLLP